MSGHGDLFLLQGGAPPVLERLHFLQTRSTSQHPSQRTQDGTIHNNQRKEESFLSNRNLSLSPDQLKQSTAITSRQVQGGTSSMPFTSVGYQWNGHMDSSFIKTTKGSQPDVHDCDSRADCGALPKSHGLADWFTHPQHLEARNASTVNDALPHSTTSIQNNMQYPASNIRTMSTIDSSIYSLAQQPSSFLIPKKLPQNVQTTSIHYIPKNLSLSGRKQDTTLQSTSSATAAIGVAETLELDASPMLLSSPYQYELARLQMEQLQIEEQHLLEIKRLSELERTRGPKPKWYELKTREFHYEAHKNNEILGHQDQWQNLLDYRKDLIQAHHDHNA